MKKFIKGYLKVLLVIIVLFIIWGIVQCGQAIKESSDKHPDYTGGVVSSSVASPQFLFSNQNEYPEISIGNFREEYDSWKGNYTLHFDVKNNSKKDIKFIQVDASIIQEGGDALKTFTGNKVKKGQSVEMFVNDISPKKPVRVVLTINKEMTDFLSTIK